MQELAWSSWMWELDHGMQVYLDWFKVLLFLSSFLVFCFWVLGEQKISESWESQNWIEIWNGKKKSIGKEWTWERDSCRLFWSVVFSFPDQVGANALLKSALCSLRRSSSLLVVFQNKFFSTVAFPMKFFYTLVCLQNKFFTVLPN